MTQPELEHTEVTQPELEHPEMTQPELEHPKRDDTARVGTFRGDKPELEHPEGDTARVGTSRSDRDDTAIQTYISRIFAAYISYICVLISVINDLNYPNRLSISTPNVSAASHLQWLWQMDDGGLNGDVYMNTDSAPSFSA
eukprot:CAMPEP_0171982960 /NCGR_PEP_ID=MMETSP0993-20121228/273030_1 /TAXON_ID=483369 /ORGANISM="non described non described, Strain CCMP2098" /LENGTH=140 /DNA_ID=CAMNT_0012635665 /DNA_START=815 /DNA_END=1238 /DNA_ORIENTATION=-